MWPTVFDYEDMGPCNLIGWDFVKLETELKIRAYPRRLRRRDAPYVRPGVQDFEVASADGPRSATSNRAWPEAGAPRRRPEERLPTILLAVRRMAAQHLGVNHGRPNDWLEEYYFLLACYGVYTAGSRTSSTASGSARCSRRAWPRRG